MSYEYFNGDKNVNIRMTKFEAAKYLGFKKKKIDKFLWYVRKGIKAGLFEDK